MTFVGTEDFQGPAQWQSLALLQEARTIANLATFQWPAGGGTFPVANWQSIQVGPTGSNAGIIDWIYQWYADSAGTILLGARLLSTTTVGADAFTLGNLGPFLTITALNNSGGSRSVAMYATLTNRIQAPFDPMSSAPMIHTAPTTVGAGLQATVVAQYLYAGPVSFWVATDATAWVCDVVARNSAGTQVFVTSMASTEGTGGGYRRGTLYAPPRPLFALFTNNDAVARNVYVSVTPDMFR